MLKKFLQGIMYTNFVTIRSMGLIKIINNIIPVLLKRETILTTIYVFHAVLKIGMYTIAFAFGGPAAQKLSGERDPLPELRETVLALKCDLAEEIPLIASFDLAQLLAKPKDKSLLWQDLLLAKSVLQNI